MQLSIFNDESLVTNPIKLKNISSKIKLDKTQPFLRYPGSKFRAAKYIAPFWADIVIEEYREPFLGSGAIFFKMPKVEFSWLNDFDQELINLFQIVSSKENREKLINLNLNITPSKDYFNHLKSSNPSNKLQKAFKYFVINRMAYSGIMKHPNWGFHPIKSVQPDKWAARLNEAGLKLQDNVKITSHHFTEIIEAPSNKSVWLFVDPPYFKADQTRAYLHSFKLEDHLELMESLKKTPHKFCLTYDNCDEIKSLYSWANIHEIDWMYHTANSNVTTRKIGKELIITNYDF
jgi:DNA adenine methylase